MPAEEDGRLHDPAIRETFLEQIFTLRRWRDTLTGRKSMGGLVDFHTRHKLLLLSHSETIYREMGRLVAMGKQLAAGELFNRYEVLLQEALSLKTTVKKNLNVLSHMLGYFKKMLTVDEKQEVLEIIESLPRRIPAPDRTHHPVQPFCAQIRHRLSPNSRST